MRDKKLPQAALLLLAAAGTVWAAISSAADTVKTTQDIEYARVADQPLRLDLYEPAAA